MGGGLNKPTTETGRDRSERTSARQGSLYSSLARRAGVCTARRRSAAEGGVDQRAAPARAEGVLEAPRGGLAYERRRERLRASEKKSKVSPHSRQQWRRSRARARRRRRRHSGVRDGAHANGAAQRQRSRPLGQAGAHLLERHRAPLEELRQEAARRNSPAPTTPRPPGRPGP